MVLANVNSPWGLVNGARGSAVGIIVEPNTEFFPLDDIHIICTKPPRCVLFRALRPRTSKFGDLEDGVVPVFPITRSISIKNCSIRRRQIPMCPAFSLTDYKVQSQTLSEALLDLGEDNSIKSRDPHRKFCSFIVQLSRIQSLDGLHLLRPIQMSDLNLKPHPDMLSEMSRLEALEKLTLESWESELDSHRSGG